MNITSPLFAFTRIGANGAIIAEHSDPNNCIVAVRSATTEPRSRGADVTGVSPSPGADVAGASPSPSADVGRASRASPGADVAGVCALTRTEPSLRILHHSIARSISIGPWT